MEVISGKMTIVLNFWILPMKKKVYCTAPTNLQTLTQLLLPATGVVIGNITTGPNKWWRHMIDAVIVMDLTAFRKTEWPSQGLIRRRQTPVLSCGMCPDESVPPTRSQPTKTPMALYRG